MNAKDQANEQYKRLIQQSLQAYKAGNYVEARRLAQHAVKVVPGKDDAWLLLAACSSTKPRLEYLRRALSINPHNQRTRNQYRLTLQQLTNGKEPSQIKEPTLPKKRINRPTTPLFAVIPWIISVFIFGSGFIYFIGNSGNTPTFQTNPVAKQIYAALYPTNSPVPVQPTIITATPQDTATSNPTYTATVTATRTSTNTPFPSATPKPTQTLTPTSTIPSAAIGEEHWIDIDISEQKLYAYEKNNIVKTFIVSTGIDTHPTIPGEYRIYLMYVADDMAGPGYYLYDVPFVMYYHNGYGIHGTYWHTNFGTPASHGCTNMRPEDAEWLFYWASLNTLVNIHY